jgi:teichuronic acid biosynthesis glycosyltransferase TuaG
MLKEVKISVIVTTYKRLDRLANCLNAILNQTALPQEIIVVHDGPNEDFTQFMLQNFEDQINSGLVLPLNTVKWKGRPAPARNLGLKLSRGRYIAFCDDDDIWMPQKLEIQFKYMEENDSVDALFSYYTPYFEGEKIEFSAANSSSLPKVITSDSVFLSKFLYGYGLCLSSSFIKKNSLIDFNFEDASYIKAFEDYALWLNMIIKNKLLVVLEAPLLYYLMNNKNSIRKGRIKHNLRLSSYIFYTLAVNRKFAMALISPFIRFKYLIKKSL